MHSHSSATARASRLFGEQNSSPGPRTSALGQELDRLVGGTLAAQEYRDRLETLTESVQATDEKVINLTRLVKLSQSIQEEKEAELRQQNDELRARLKRQEQLTAQLQRQLGDVQAAVHIDVAEQVTQRIHAHLTATTAQQQEQWEAIVARVAELENRLQHSSTSVTDRFEQRLTQLDERLQRVAQSHVDATNQWARRNFVRFKEHVDSLRADVEEIRGGQQELKTTMQSASCRAEAEYKKVLLILQRKTKEADALTALIEKELEHLQKVAKRHQVLASAEITPTFEIDDKPYSALKYTTGKQK